jgi:hypothetical protein
MFSNMYNFIYGKIVTNSYQNDSFFAQVYMVNEIYDLGFNTNNHNMKYVMLMISSTITNINHLHSISHLIYQISMIKIPRKNVVI